MADTVAGRGTAGSRSGDGGQPDPDRQGDPASGIPYVGAVDWGTSSFRLWLLATDGAVLGVRRGGEGMTAAAKLGFANVLERNLAALGAPGDLPVLVCGMAGARQGWKEAGYLDTPAELDRIAEAAISVTAGGRDIRILPGIAQRDRERPDVMRGEETQLLGLLADGMRDGLACMPGTHCKWVQLSEGRVERYATFMTGELFAAISGHTILHHSLGERPEFNANAPDFRAGVTEALAAPQRLSNRLFAIRAGGLLGLGEGDAAARLSGLLVGLEIAGAREMFGTIVGPRLVASGRHAELYSTALTAAGVEAGIVDAEDAVRRGLLTAAKAIWPTRSETSTT